MKTIMLLLVLTAGAAWGQKTQTCRSCGAADMSQQFPSAIPRHPNPSGPRNSAGPSTPQEQKNSQIREYREPRNRPQE